MSDLSQLSLQRANLPSFPGDTVVAQLLAGRDAALGVLLKYVPEMQFDPAAASDTLRQIQAWEERNSDALASVLADPNAEALPQQLQITFGSDKARQFIIAIFTQAAVGLGPWMSGAVSREAQSGVQIQDRWARDDADARLQVFGSIVKMDQDGHLAAFFVPPSPASAQGLGLAVPAIIVWAVVVTLATAGALLLLYFYNAKRLEQNNKLMSDLCTQAQERGDAETVRLCIKAAEGLQKEDPFGGISDLFRKIGVGVAVAGVAYVVVRYGLPVLLSSRRQSREGYA